MRLGEIDKSLKPIEASMFLCKPNRQIISPLKDIYNATFSLKMGKVNELNFVIPSMIERGHRLIDNPLIEKIKHRYLVKLEYNNQVEYLVFLEANKSFQSNGEEVSYRLYSEGYLLADKTIREYEAVSKTLSEILTEVLEYTVWKVGYVDSYFDLTYRSHEISSQTVLQAVYELAEKFNTIIVWDTVNFTINLYNPANVGMNKGLKFKEGKYLESFNVTTNSEEIVTRLKVYGKDGLTIRKLTPTGSNYLEDFSYFTYPFEQDVNGNVIRSSDYMSDELCIALENYSQTLANAQGQFDTYTTNLGLKQDELQQREQELSVLQTELIQILDEIDVLNSTGNAGTPAHTTAVQNRVNKEAEITSKISIIAGIDSEIATLDANWLALRITLMIESNLSPAEILELNKYIIEKEHTNDTIIDEEDLLLEAISVFNEFREPKVSLSMSIINFLSVVEAQNDWNKLYLGDIVTTESQRLGVSIQAKIIEIEYDFENDGINLVIANEKEIKDADAKWLDQIYGAEQTSTTLSMDKYKWDMIEDTNGVVGELLSNAWSTIERNITAGYQQNITISERGIIIKSPDDPMSWLVIQNGQLAITNDNGNNWKTAISKDGVVAERIIGRLIMGQKLIIEDENGIMRFTGSLQEIFDDLGEVKVAIGEYETGKYGMRIQGGALEIINGLDASHISPELYEDLQYDDTQLKIDLRLTAPLPTSISLNASGITATTSDPNKFARLDYRGLYIQGGAIDIRTSALTNRGVILDANGLRAYNTGGVQTFNIDANGNATFKGILNGASGSFSGSLYGADITGVTGNFSGDIISGGTIRSVALESVTIKSANIDIADSIQVGNTITLGKNSFGYKALVFSQNSSIYQPNNTVSLVLDTVGYIFIGGDVKFAKYGGGATTLDFAGAVINNLNVVAKFG